MPGDVFAIRSNYQHHHPAILPKPYFNTCSVEEGSVGAETIGRVRMNAFGASREFYFVISESKPGRVLMEADKSAGVVTTLTLTPFNNNQPTRVTITTDARATSGLTGLVERLINPMITRSIFRKELGDTRSVRAI